MLKKGLEPLRPPKRLNLRHALGAEKGPAPFFSIQQTVKAGAKAGWAFHQVIDETMRNEADTSDVRDGRTPGR